MTTKTRNLFLFAWYINKLKLSVRICLDVLLLSRYVYSMNVQYVFFWQFMQEININLKTKNAFKITQGSHNRSGKKFPDSHLHFAGTIII